MVLASPLLFQSVTRAIDPEKHGYGAITRTNINFYTTISISDFVTLPSLFVYHLELNKIQL